MWLLQEPREAAWPARWGPRDSTSLWLGATVSKGTLNKHPSKASHAILSENVPRTQAVWVGLSSAVEMKTVSLLWRWLSHLPGSIPFLQSSAVHPPHHGTHLPLAPLPQPLHFWRWLLSFNTQLSSHDTTFYKQFISFYQILALTTACVCSRTCAGEGFTFHEVQLSTYFPYGISLFEVCVLSYAYFPTWPMRQSAQQVSV